MYSFVPSMHLMLLGYTATTKPSSFRLPIAPFIHAADHASPDWLRHEIGVAKLPVALTQASRLDSDRFVASVCAALPKRELYPARLAQLREAFADTAEPARAVRAAALTDGCTPSGIVNRAYGLTPQDIALMWRTAPPRMPLAPHRQTGSRHGSAIMRSGPVDHRRP